MITFSSAAYDVGGELGVVIAREVTELMMLQQHVSSTFRFRAREWDNEVALTDLFESEGLSPREGRFIDQRYIDFLDHQFGAIGDINWRKFEALTAEFFGINGWHVELGPGRGDGGVDIRLWQNEPERGEPATVLVQCKRQRSAVEVAVVKALWSDVRFEDAAAGLVVTTSRLSPGARKVIAVRGYDVREADRNTLRTWVAAMRSPQVGAFLAE